MFVSENDFGREVPKNELLIESDEDPHINVGSHFQANVESCQKSSHPSKIQSHEDLVWEPAIKHGVMDNEGTKLLLLLAYVDVHLIAFTNTHMICLLLTY